MSVRYQYSGLTPELYQRLVSEHAALRQTHKKGSYKQFFQDVKQCSEVQARIIYQAFNSAVVERARISPATVDRLEGIISDELFDDLQDYLSTNYTRGKNTEWSERLDNEVDRIILKYRTKGKLGREKTTVKKALYTAYALGV